MCRFARRSPPARSGGICTQCHRFVEDPLLAAIKALQSHLGSLSIAPFNVGDATVMDDVSLRLDYVVKELIMICLC